MKERGNYLKSSLQWESDTLEQGLKDRTSWQWFEITFPGGTDWAENNINGNESMYAVLYKASYVHGHIGSS